MATVQETYYRSESFVVRPIHKRDGRQTFGLCRPGSGAVIDEFEREGQAAFIAAYCEVHHNGTYAAEARKAAARAWRVLQGEPVKAGTRLNPEQVIDRLLAQIGEATEVELLGFDSTSVLFQVTFKDGKQKKGVFYQPHPALPEMMAGEWELED